MPGHFHRTVAAPSVRWALAVAGGARAAPQREAQCPVPHSVPCSQEHEPCTGWGVLQAPHPTPLLSHVLPTHSKTPHAKGKQTQLPVWAQHPSSQAEDKAPSPLYWSTGLSAALPCPHRAAGHRDGSLYWSLTFYYSIFFVLFSFSKTLSHLSLLSNVWLVVFLSFLKLCFDRIIISEN